MRLEHAPGQAGIEINNDDRRVVAGPAWIQRHVGDVDAPAAAIDDEILGEGTRPQDVLRQDNHLVKSVLVIIPADELRLVSAITEIEHPDDAVRIRPNANYAGHPSAIGPWLAGPELIGIGGVVAVAGDGPNREFGSDDRRDGDQNPPVAHHRRVTRPLVGKDGDRFQLTLVHHRPLTISAE